MKSLDITKLIVEEINNLGVGLKASPNPLASTAPMDIENLSSSGGIYVWYDYSPTHRAAPQGQNNLPIKGAAITKYLRFVVSVGLNTLESVPQLDEIVESIEDDLTHIIIGECEPLSPAGISRISVTPNKVYWRQIWFETSVRLKKEMRRIG